MLHNYCSDCKLVVSVTYGHVCNSGVGVRRTERCIYREANLPGERRPQHEGEKDAIRSDKEDFLRGVFALE